MTASGPPERVRVREVGPRDGFQNEPERIATKDKVRLIDALARTGLRRIEVASFVRPDVIPQLDDAIEVLHAIDVPDGVELTVLVPNERGLRTALGHRERWLAGGSGEDRFEHREALRRDPESRLAKERPGAPGLHQLLEIPLPFRIPHSAFRTRQGTGDE